jgi:hypothetical protein
MALLTTVISLILTSGTQSGEVPADRFQALATGITANLAVAPVTGSLKGKFDFSMGLTDDKQIGEAGFRAVRFVFEPADLYTPNSPEDFDPNRIAVLLKSIDEAHQSGLAVTVAPHLTRADLRNAASFLGRLAGALGKTDVDNTFLEVCSDPLGMDPAVWSLVQESWVASIRQNLPRHTLVVRAGGKDTAAELTQSTPLTDRNVVYAFQFFEPETFTNQWLPGSKLQESDNVTLPYPSNLTTIIPIVGKLDDIQKDWAVQYAREQWDALKLTDRIQPVGEWARSKRVRVICDSFGVSQKVNALDRAKYLQDLKSVFGDAGIAWTLSEYVGPRGIFSGAPGVRQADKGVISALGLSG